MNSIHNVLPIWNDIQSSIINHPNHNNNDISTLSCLWLKCCIETNKIDITQCIQMLKWIQKYCNQMSLLGYLTNKLISKCKNSKESLEYIHQLIKINFFIGHNDNIMIQNSLINAYGECKDIENALNVFNAINNNIKDEITLSAMMKVLINNNKSGESLRLYRKYDKLHNEITDMLAIKACIATNDEKHGRSIHGMTKIFKVFMFTTH